MEDKRELKTDEISVKDVIPPCVECEESGTSLCYGCVNEIMENIQIN